MTSDAFVRHYTAVADASAAPVLLYNVSLFTGVNLLPDAVQRLAEHPNIIGMKESNADLVQLAETIARTPDDFVVLGGSAPTFYHALCAGADGGVLAISGVVPDICVEMVDLRSSAMPRRSRCSAASRRSDGCWARCTAS
jgi:4-hydroxy-2-oxoglutarate aldolase